MEADERFVKQVIDYMGDEHIVFSAGLPHPDTKYPHSVETFLGKNPMKASANCSGTTALGTTESNLNKTPSEEVSCQTPVN